MISIWRQSLELVEEGGLKVFLNRVLEIGGEGGYIQPISTTNGLGFEFRLRINVVPDLLNYTRLVN